MFIKSMLALFKTLSLPVKLLLISNLLTLCIMAVPVIRVRYYKLRLNHYISAYEEVKSELDELKKKIKNVKRFGEESNDTILDASPIEEDNDIHIPVPELQQ